MPQLPPPFARHSRARGYFSTATEAVFRKPLRRRAGLARIRFSENSADVSCRDVGGSCTTTQDPSAASVHASCRCHDERSYLRPQPSSPHGHSQQEGALRGRSCASRILGGAARPPPLGEVIGGDHVKFREHAKTPPAWAFPPARRRRLFFHLALHQKSRVLGETGVRCLTSLANLAELIDKRGSCQDRTEEGKSLFPRPKSGRPDAPE